MVRELAHRAGLARSLVANWARPVDITWGSACGRADVSSLDFEDGALGGFRTTGTGHGRQEASSKPHACTRAARAHSGGADRERR